MENRNVGLLLIIISLLVGFIFFLFNNISREALNSACSHGPSCIMNKSLNAQVYITYSLVFLIFIVGLIIMFTKPSEKIVIKERIKKFKDQNKNIDLKSFDEKERKIIEILQKENGAVFQASLIESLGIGKVALTRLLDKLEAKQVIERKRRGMNNIVVLKRN